jgi:predicted amidohydrolase
MIVGFLQNRPRLGQLRANLDEALALTEGIDADLLVFPELFATGYFFEDACELREWAETPEGPTTLALLAWCRDRSCHVAFGFPEKAPEGVYNAAALVGPHGPVGLYRKSHLFNEEKRLFLPGNSGFPVFSLPFARVGMLICFDWFFPEAARSLALGGAQILLHPSNLVLPHGQRAMRTRSLENRVFTITANRTGEDLSSKGRRLVFTGGSQVTDPEGGVLLEASHEAALCAVVEIEPGRSDDKRPTPWNHAFDDRRRDLYRLQ